MTEQRFSLDAILAASREYLSRPVLVAMHAAPDVYRSLLRRAPAHPVPSGLLGVRVYEDTDLPDGEWHFEWDRPTVAAPATPEETRSACALEVSGQVGRCFKCHARVDPETCANCGKLHVGTYCWPCHHENVRDSSGCLSPFCPEHSRWPSPSVAPSPERTEEPSPEVSRERDEGAAVDESKGG